MSSRLRTVAKALSALTYDEMTRVANALAYAFSIDEEGEEMEDRPVSAETLACELSAWAKDEISGEHDG